MTWFDDEKSVQDSAPAELFTFTSPTITYRLTSHQNDVEYNGNTYTATPASRSSLLLPTATEGENEFTVQMPAGHALPQYYKSGIPPRELTCNVSRYQPVSGVALAIGSGYVENLNFEGGKPPMATFRVTPLSAFATPIPSVDCGKLCRHTLYDARCTVSKVAHQVATTIATISTDRRTVTVASIGGHADAWAQHGYIEHASTTERRTIKTQTGTTLVFYHPLPPTVEVGASVLVQAGCDKRVSTCFEKFLNVINFGNLPHLPTSNPWYVDPRYKS